MTPSQKWIESSGWTIFSAVCLVAAICGAVFLSAANHRAPVGVLIGVMGFIAAGITFRHDPGKTEKAIWIILMTVLLVAEIRNLYVADAEATAKFSDQTEKLGKISDGLSTAIAGINTTVTNSQSQIDASKDQFTATIKKSNTLLALSQESLKNITGGDSFCYVSMSMEKNATPVWLLHVGKNHAFDVYVRIDDIEGLDREAKAGKLFENQNQYEMKFGPLPIVLRGTGQPLTTIPGFAADTNYKRYNVFIMARNGSITELIRLKRDPNSHLWAEALLVTASYYDGRHGVVFKQAGDFPVDALAQDKDWANAEKAPILHIEK